MSCTTILLLSWLMDQPNGGYRLMNALQENLASIRAIGWFS